MTIKKMRATAKYQDWAIVFPDGWVTLTTPVDGPFDRLDNTVEAFRAENVESIAGIPFSLRVRLSRAGFDVCKGVFLS